MLKKTVTDRISYCVSVFYGRLATGAWHVPRAVIAIAREGWLRRDGAMSTWLRRGRVPAARGLLVRVTVSIRGVPRPAATIAAVTGVGLKTPPSRLENRCAANERGAGG